MRIKSTDEWDALIHYHREAMHRYPESLHLGLVEWVDNERKGEDMTRGEFATHCLECLRIEREDARVTCPLCRAEYDYDSWVKNKGHICA
jgi:hypothetical protein